jgi:hypothetical protein
LTSKLPSVIYHRVYYWEIRWYFMLGGWYSG